MDLIITARGKVTVVTIEGNLKVVTGNKHEIKFFITGVKITLKKLLKSLARRTSGIILTLII